LELEPWNYSLFDNDINGWAGYRTFTGKSRKLRRERLTLASYISGTHSVAMQAINAHRMTLTALMQFQRARRAS